MYDFHVRHGIAPKRGSAAIFGLAKVGVSAAISVGLVGLKAPPTTIERTVPAPFAVLFHIRMPFNLKLWSAIADASRKAHLTEPHKQTVGQKVRPQQNDNTVRVARKRTLEAENQSSDPN